MTLNIVILAAGQGSRMKSEMPKVLHTIAEKPLLGHVLDTAAALQSDKTIVVYGHGGDQVRQTFIGRALTWIEQIEQQGTGHAVLQTISALDDDATVLVLYGDVPLLRPTTLEPLVEKAAQGPALLTAVLTDPQGYGRVIRDEKGLFARVVEQKDAGADELRVQEVNTGVMAMPALMLKKYLPRVTNNNAQGEYYLPDVLSMAVTDGFDVQVVTVDDAIETEGVNTRAQLVQLERAYQLRQVQTLMAQGLGVADPARVDIRGTLTAGKDCFVDVNAVFEGEVVLGDGVIIEPNCVIRNSTIGSGTRICAMSHLEQAIVGASANIGPFARLRPGTELADKTKIGNFVETKKAVLGEGSKVNHLSYIGDAVLGAGVNVGAGTITCNYDGANKFQTTMGDNVFIGSNSTLVAPVTIETDGFVGAGSVVTKTVGQGELAIGRGKQRNISGWTRPKKNK
ncbi:MAG: bifunctional UDP-N-acetylglucosamine diphosphorylase/glucosamine-1-phosphate N-acetyltransferase GlmU [Halieaceae bacterium]|nr:bifunctional UDP-N-acetylglucosamine diphosphorylase/glucosamine-1-phosphate N-acetyltransferase GlmU [Halieaceae bacterium]